MYIKIFVTPDAKRESIKEKGNPSRRGEGEAETLAIAVKEPAVGNRANTRVREIIAGRFGVSISKVRILTGHCSRSKMISIAN